MNTDRARKIQILSSAMMIVYYVIMAASLGYFMAYLVGAGCTPGFVGILIAVYSAGAAFFQPLLGRISDSSPFFDWKKQLFVLGGFGIIFSILMIFLRGKTESCILFVLVSVIVQCMGPLIFASPFYYQRYGIEVNFGKIRAFGSLSYAIAAYVLGQMISGIGLVIIPVCCSLFMFLISVICILLPRMSEPPQSLSALTKEQRRDALLASIEHQKARSSLPIWKKYPNFPLLLTAVFFIMFTFNMVNAYLLQIVERAGGNSAMLGTAGAVGAVFEIPMIFFFTALLKRLSVTRLIIIGAIGFTLRAALYIFLASPAGVLGVTAMSCVSYAIMAPAVVYVTDRMIHPEDAITGQAMMASAQMVCSIVSNVIFGVIYDSFGLVPVLASSAVFSLIGVILAVIADKRCGMKPEA